MMHWSRRTQAGQSLPIIALVIVVIIGMVALAVDVGNAYGQQRRVQNITNAGALAGMNSVVANQTNRDVCTNVQRTLSGNRVDTGSSNYEYDVHYVFAGTSTEPQLVCRWTGTTLVYAPGMNMDGTPPQNIVRVQVTAREHVDTFFARVVGQNQLTVNANGSACLGTYGPNVYPLGVPLNLVKNYHTINTSTGATLNVNDAKWGDWSKMIGYTVTMPIENWADSNPGTHVAWFDWTPGASGASELRDGMTYPGTLAASFTEATSPDPARPNTAPFGKLNAGDWVEGGTGTRSTISSQLNDLIRVPGTTQPRKVILPMYTDALGTGSNAKFYIQKLAFFEVVSYNFGGQGNGSAFIKVRYLGDANVSPEECAGEPATCQEASGPSCDPPKTFNIAGTTKVNRVWRTAASSSKTYDIVLVMDTSGSMGRDWRDRESNESGYTGPRLNDAKQSIINFVQQYDIAEDPDARMAFVTFSGTSTPARVEANWTKACSTPTSGCGGASGKWSGIQQKASGMTANGYTPGPIAFESVEDLLKNKRTPPSGKQYGQIVLFATDGVFNVCGKDVGNVNCPYSTLVQCTGAGSANCINNAGYNMVSGRPVWQGQQVAGRIKANGASIFVIALTPTCRANDSDCFDPAGLPEMSSGSGYYYSARDGGAMQNIYSLINAKIDDDTCKPVEDGDPGILAEGATMVLTRPSNPTFRKTDVTDSNGQWNFSDLEPGDYVVKVVPSLDVRTSGDGLWRTYSRLRNGYNLAEETQASVYINQQLPDGSTVPSEVRLSMPIDPATGAPFNGCNSGRSTR